MTDLVLADDHIIFAEALAEVLTKENFDVLAIAKSISGMIEAVREHQPDVCLLDRHFVDGDGVDAVGDIIGASVETRVVVLTADPDVNGIARALQCGAQGYVHKSFGSAVLIGAIARVMRNDGVVVEVPGRRSPHRSRELMDARRLASYLTARERECLALIVEGLATKAMAERLQISQTTVRTHAQSMLTKLGVHSRLEAASFAVRNSLVDPMHGVEVSRV